MDSPKWLKNKKTTANPKNGGNKCFQYAVTVRLNHKKFLIILKELAILKNILIIAIGKSFHLDKNSGKDFKN